MVAPNVVLIACGSFSPPTPMHFRMFEIARDYFRQMGTHNVIGGIMSPVHDAYNKNGLVSSTHRSNMIRLGLQSSDWIRLSDWETRQEGWTRTRVSLQYHQNYINSYLNDDMSEQDDTVDLQLPSWLPDDVNNRSPGGPVQLKLLCGADILESFSSPNVWDPEDLETILGQHGIVVITRSGSNPEQFIFNSDLLSKYKRNITLITNWVANEVSSTMARRLISRGNSVKYLLDDRIVDYIRNNGLFVDKSSATMANNKSIKSPLQDGIVLKLNRLNSERNSQSMMAVTPSPEDVLDAPDTRRSGSNHHQHQDDGHKSNNVFCCDPISSMSSSKRSNSDRKASRRRRGPPGQAVQVLFDGQASAPSIEEVRHRHSVKEHHNHKVGSATKASPSTTATTPITSSPSASSLAPKPKSVSIINCAPQQQNIPNHTALCAPQQLYKPPPICTPPPLARSASVNSHTLLRKALQEQPNISVESPEGGEVTTRNYDDMIKFVFTEHGIKVISDKEYVV